MGRGHATFVIALVVGLGGCAPGSSGAGARDGGSPPEEDASRVEDAATECSGAGDGEACGDGLICLDEDCVPSRCGDGFVDPSRDEDCEDGNAIDGDGCDAGCTFTCRDDTDCVNDGEECNGIESCDVASHVCVTSTPPEEGATCASRTGMTGSCRAAMCVPAECGNGILDPGEDCDDMNADDEDGCRRDCTWRCVADPECADETVCNGAETCDVASHRCMPGTPLVCDDGSPCTTDSCDATSGCVSALIDADGDGEAPASLGACGSDCDDTRPTVCEACSEICLDTIDNDCNGVVDDGLTTWFADCDGDGYPPVGAVVVMDCAMPSLSLTGCSTSTRQWVRRSPAVDPDCNDADRSVRPGIAEIVGNSRDDNCDGREICYRDADGDRFRSTSTVPSSDTDCDDAGEARTTAGRDCCDSDRRVYPGATAWHTGAEAQSACGGWDFDCDGTATRYYTDREDRTCAWSGSCTVPSSADGWHGSSFPGICIGAPSPSPACGTMPYCRVDNCHGAGAFSCSYDISAVRQRCR